MSETHTDPNPTESLKKEHGVVLVVVGAMDREAAHIRAGGMVHADDVERMLEFTREFTDGCHHRKEERVLFPLLGERVPMANTPVSVMLAEHDKSRAYVRALVEALPQARRGDRDAAERTAVALEGYAKLLRAHIDKENSVLFPLAERALQAADKARLAEEFERIEREETGDGAHEKHHALARELRERQKAR